MSYGTILFCIVYLNSLFFGAAILLPQTPPLSLLGSPQAPPLRLHPQALFKLFQRTSKTLPDIFSGLLLTGLSPCRVHADRSQPHANASEEVPTRFRQHEITRRSTQDKPHPTQDRVWKIQPHLNRFRRMPEGTRTGPEGTRTGSDKKQANKSTAAKENRIKTQYKPNKNLRKT